jgi:hypothetical protein
VLLLVSGAQLSELEMREDLFDDFCLSPFHPKEFEARLRHLMFRSGRSGSPEIASYGDLILNFETYQAAFRTAARPHLHGVRAAALPRTRARCSRGSSCSHGCGATRLWRRAPSTTCGGSGRSSARSAT